jgi:squalene-hopene/tetraprenyl-beta-curcumene cyclase
MKTQRCVAGLVVLFLLAGGRDLPGADDKKGQPAHQYEHGEIRIAAAEAAEPVRETFSLERALDYLDRGAIAWTREKNCVSCHTNGSYLLTRPALSDFAGAPDPEVRDFFASEVATFQKMDEARMMKGLTPSKIVYLALGLAEWDRHVTGSLSPETEAAIEVMFRAQSSDGSFRNLDCWPPLESSNYHSATAAAMAVAAAPGWIEGVETGASRKGFEKLKDYLREIEPPHDYGKVLLLWAEARLPGLVGRDRVDAFLQVLRDQQREDGGWSLRTFSAPEKWGGGNRAEKLRAEADFASPASDGHMTGLAVLVLRESGVAAEDPAVRRGVEWLLANQRESGRWWTRSLSTDKYHFITYSGTCYPLLALAKCGVLEAKVADSR